ncbi:MAG: hypothetical protein ICV60_06480 [Pyrinomonadaceae bacterium]|nr:hypothetical protein [Pyrinomonadaceae bacterium]
MRESIFNLKPYSFTSLLLAFLLLAACGSTMKAKAQGNNKTAPAVAATPSDAVRQFYKALSEKRFRDALMATALRPAIENLSASEFEELRPDFERMAVDADKVQLTGEQISGDRASVFVKLVSDMPSDPPIEVQLRRSSGNWILIFNDEVEKAVKRDGNKYFFKLRIEAHEQDAQSMLVNIAQKELLYSMQHNGAYADLQTLVKERLLPDDVLSSQSTGYNFRVTLSADKKSYTAGAEPAVYGRTGLQSFYMDPKGIKKADTGGKPYMPK